MVGTSPIVNRLVGQVDMAIPSRANRITFLGFSVELSVEVRQARAISGRVLVVIGTVSLQGEDINPEGGDGSRWLIGNQELLDALVTIDVDNHKVLRAGS